VRFLLTPVALNKSRWYLCVQTLGCHGPCSWCEPHSGPGVQAQDAEAWENASTLDKEVEADLGLAGLPAEAFRQRQSDTSVSSATGVEAVRGAGDSNASAADGTHIPVAFMPACIPCKLTWLPLHTRVQLCSKSSWPMGSSPPASVLRPASSQRRTTSAFSALSTPTSARSPPFHAPTRTSAILSLVLSRWARRMSRTAMLVNKIVQTPASGAVTSERSPVQREEVRSLASSLQLPPPRNGQPDVHGSQLEQVAL